LCDLNAARRVMSEAQRLKMTGGHFIWIWADTSSTAEFFEPNSLPDDKDQLMKSNYHSQGYNERKSKYDKLASPPGDRQYYLQSGNKRPQQNSTRHKSPNTNSNRFHHIVGLRKPGDESGGVMPAVLPDRSFLSAGQATVKDKRDVKTTTMDSTENDYDSVEKASNLNIKNINSHEFNANYYDPYTPREHENIENIFGGDQDESHEDNEYWDYEKVNPFQPTSATVTTTRRSASDTGATKISKANSRKNPNNSNRSNRNNGNNHKPPTPDQITTIPYSKIFDDNDDLDLESYSEASESDLKAKRADNFPSAFNISSHVFFHHFKDFPVGLLALRHIKMNVDRVFVRSAVRLFATTWSRVERDEELRAASGGKLDYRPKSNWEDSFSDYDYDEASTSQRNNAKKQKNKNNFSVNNRHNNARGSRKYKRETAGERVDDNPIISNLVNSRNKTTINSNSKLVKNETYSQHVSGLNSHASDVENKSNNDNVKSNSNKSAAAVNGDQETVRELNVKGEIEVAKRQGSWWSNLFRGGQEKPVKVPTRGTPQYKGGCFGVPTRSDAKRSELFAR
jgi:hypothetical protein